MDIKHESLEFLGNDEEFARAVEQVCYTVSGKGVHVTGSENPLRGLPPKIQAISKASNNLLGGLRAPEIISLFDDAQFEEWQYLSRDQINIDGVVISIGGIHDHVLEPPNPPLWQLGLHRVAAGYCIRIPTSSRILSLCLHAIKVQTGPNPIVRRVEFRAMSRDPKNYSEDRNKLYHPRRWESQEVVSAIAFNLGPTSNGKTAITAEYYDIVEPFYKFITDELQGVLIRRNILTRQGAVSPQTAYPDITQKSREDYVSPENKLIVLFLAANPNETTRLYIDQEVSAIDKELRKTEYRNRFDLRPHWAVQYDDLQELFLRYQPSIVHFSGHGSEAGKVILQDKNGNARMLPVEALASLFGILKDKVQCVVLNACYSEKQANAIAEHVECVIGMSRAITDSAAIDFASAFYLGLGYGRSVQTAFAMGRNRIDLAGFDEVDTPQLLATRSNPDEVILVNEPSLYSNQNNKKGINLKTQRRDTFIINRLSGAQIQQLQDAILSAFNESELRQMVRVKLDANLSAIAGGTTLAEIVFNLITWAERTGNVVNLIQGAVSVNPTNSNLLMFISSLDET